MANLSGSPARVESTIAEVLRSGRRPSPAHIPFSAAAEEGLVRAAQQARLWGDDHIGTEHTLLGLLVAANDAAVRQLQEVGVTYDAARAEITRLRAAG
jgi:ATP-dependent Clp protease ATP-binding subunit ClpA